MTHLQALSMCFLLGQYCSACWNLLIPLLSIYSSFRCLVRSYIVSLCLQAGLRPVIILCPPPCPPLPVISRFTLIDYRSTCDLISWSFVLHLTHVSSLNHTVINDLVGMKWFMCYVDYWSLLWCLGTESLCELLVLKPHVWLWTVGQAMIAKSFSKTENSPLHSWAMI